MAFMRALIVTPHPPYPPHQGASLRNYGILSSIHQAGGSITLLSFCSNPAQQAAPALQQLCEKIVFVPTPARTTTGRIRDIALTAQPDLARRLHSSAFADALRALLAEREFDLIQFEGLEVAAYLSLARKRGAAAKLVYDAHNAEYALQQNIASIEGRTVRRAAAAVYSRIQARRITRFERAICASADAVIAVSEEDAALLRQLGAETPVSSLANGIFTASYAPTTSTVKLAGQPLVFTGKMDYRPNVDAMLWFADAIFPLVLNAHADAHLYVVGQSPHAHLAALEDGARPISFTRWVESVKPFLHGAAVFIAPLRMGSGTRLKILEAMAAGCAVVATSAAVAGLAADVRAALCIEDGAPAFAGAINRLLADPSERAQMGAHARAVVEQHYDWRVLAPQLIDIYRKMGVNL